MKKLITAMLSAAVLLASGSAALAAEDVLIPKISDWARPAVEAAQKDGTIPSPFGVTDYTQNISREKFCELAVAALVKANMAPSGYAIVSPFADTGNASVAALYHSGIIRGRSETVFSPEDSITREEAAAILYRMAAFMEIPIPAAKDGAAFYDVSLYTDDPEISDWARDGIYAMRALSVMTGTEAQMFSPKSPYTVEQAVITMVRLLEVKNK